MSARKEVVDLRVPLGRGEAALAPLAAARLGISPSSIEAIRVLRHALDARKRQPLAHVYRVEVTVAEEAVSPGPVPVVWPEVPVLPAPPLRSPAAAGGVAIIGAGPAGLFCAWRLALAGVPATVYELGRAVEDRKHDIALLMRTGHVDRTSNLCFGEGGAGTFSDGKLYTRRREPETTQEILAAMVAFGAPREILWEARPHVGTDKLGRLLRNLRAGLVERGVTIRFGTSVDDLVIHERAGRRVCVGVRLADGTEEPASAVVLAIGHSARAMYVRLCEREVRLEAKALAVGVRVEHPQRLIDELQYGRHAGHPDLPPASYAVTAAADGGGGRGYDEQGAGAGRGVYSFCMCPGGMIVPSATEPDGICVNGMSASRRNTPYANAALVVTVSPADFAWRFPDEAAAVDDADEAAALRHPVLAGVAFQRRLERRAARLGGGAQRAPAQRFADFLAGRASSTTPRVSYRPGVQAGDVREALPGFVAEALAQGAALFGRRMRGFTSAEATLIGVETRTSAPVRIVRDATTLESPSVAALYPCGEGAGYAGGITSSALDGWRTAEAILAGRG